MPRCNRNEQKNTYRTAVSMRYLDQVLLDKMVTYLRANQTAMLWPYLVFRCDLDKLLSSEVSDIMRAWAESPSLDSLVLLLNAGFDVNARDEFGNGFLMYAGVAHEDLRDIINFLLSRGVDMNRTNNRCETPLIHAMIDMVLIKVRVLLQYKEVDVNRRDCHGGTTLMYAARVGQPDLIKLLVAAGADVNLRDDKGYTALFWTDGNISVAKALLEKGADPNIVDNDGDSVLFMGLEHFTQGHFEFVKLLLEYGANVNMYNVNEPTKTALCICFEKCLATRRLMMIFENTSNPEKYLKLLLQKGAEPSLPTDRHWLMHTAVIENFIYMLPYFMASGVAPFETRVDEHNMYSQFFLALITSNLQLAKFFVKNWYLTPSDVQALYRGPDLLRGLKHCCLSFYDGIKEFLASTAKQPLSLTALSCIKTSSLVGSTSDRRRRIESLGLPRFLTRKLLFNSLEGELKPDNHVKRFLHWAETSVCMIPDNPFVPGQPVEIRAYSPNTHFYSCS